VSSDPTLTQVFQLGDMFVGPAMPSLEEITNGWDVSTDTRKGTVRMCLCIDDTHHAYGGRGRTCMCWVTHLARACAQIQGCNALQQNIKRSYIEAVQGAHKYYKGETCK